MLSIHKKDRWLKNQRRIRRGDTQIRTEDKGFADLGLTTWLCRLIFNLPKR